jgi:hypothetical protein
MGVVYKMVKLKMTSYKAKCTWFIRHILALTAPVSSHKAPQTTPMVLSTFSMLGNHVEKQSRAMKE